MDEIAAYNRERWKALAEADALYTRPWMDMDAAAARKLADPEGVQGELGGASVLCLGGGGGKQSAAFGLLGAQVTVLDLSPEQLERDRLMAEHYGIQVTTMEGDMRDLSMFASDAFDIVDHPYSINFVPDCREVFRQVARVLRAGGSYRVSVANPFGIAVRPSDWNGEGYVVRDAYVDGSRVACEDQEWVYGTDPGGNVPEPVEYRQNLGRVINGLAECGFGILRFSESADMYPDLAAEPGSWDHYVAFFPPWFSFLTRLQH